jgi:hypothetical protein
MEWMKIVYETFGCCYDFKLTRIREDYLLALFVRTSKRTKIFVDESDDHKLWRNGFDRRSNLGSSGI